MLLCSASIFYMRPMRLYIVIRRQTSCVACLARGHCERCDILYRSFHGVSYASSRDSTNVKLAAVWDSGAGHSLAAPPPGTAGREFGSLGSSSYFCS